MNRCLSHDLCFVRVSTVAVLTLVLLCSTGLAAEEDAWNIKPQKLTLEEIINAEFLTEERIDVPTGFARVEGPVFVPNAEKNGYILLYSFFLYGTGDSGQVVAADTLTGNVTYFVVPRGLNQHFALKSPYCPLGYNLHFDDKGRMYCVLGDRAKSAQVWRYDPKKNTFRSVATIPAEYGGYGPAISNPDNGCYYGAGKRGGWIGPWQYNPKTGEMRSYGRVGKRFTRGGEYGCYKLTAVGDYLYLANGKIPWSLVAVNTKTGEHEVILEAPAQGRGIWVWDTYAYRNPDPKDLGKREYYKLTDGKAVRVDRHGAYIRTKRFANLPRPELWDGKLSPSPDGHSEIRYKLPGAEDWQEIVMKVRTYAHPVRKLSTMPDGRLLGIPGSYEGLFIYDPKTGKGEWPGRAHFSVYGICFYDGKVYMPAYGSADVWVYDPALPWTVDKKEFGKKPINENSPQSNPRHTGIAETKCQELRTASVGSDGNIYFAGTKRRAGNGGGFGWLDPKSYKKGAMSDKNFLGFKTCYATAALGGDKIVINSHATLNNVTGKTPETAKMFIFDVKNGKLRDVEPIHRAARLGPLIEVAPGRIISVARHRDHLDKDILFGMDIQTGKVLFQKEIPVQFCAYVGSPATNDEFVLGPDGHIWTYLAVPNSLAVTLARIDPKDANIQVMGQVRRRGPMAFSGRDLYRGSKLGRQKIRRIADIVPGAP